MGTISQEGYTKTLVGNIQAHFWKNTTRKDFWRDLVVGYIVAWGYTCYWLTPLFKELPWQNCQGPLGVQKPSTAEKFGTNFIRLAS